MTIRIDALVKYGRSAASTRQRLLQFIPHLERAGIEVQVQQLLDDDYVHSLTLSGKPPRRGILTRYLRRFASLFLGPKPDLLWIYAETFPYLPGLFERFAFWKGAPVIYDFDDAFFHQYEGSGNPAVRRLLGGKLRPLLRRAAACTCGNRYLQAYADRYCARTMLLPTVVDTDVYVPRPDAVTPERPLVIGWIGSPSTWPYVRPLLPLLAELCRSHGVKIHVVGAGWKAEADAFAGLELISWSEATEVETVQAMDIGIMPLPDDGWTRGKSGYKLIQYMACGLPVVASPVGANCDIVEPGASGLLASDDGEWRLALLQLIESAALRERIGRSARVRVETHYSTAGNAAKLIDLIRDLTASEEPGR